MPGRHAGLSFHDAGSVRRRGLAPVASIKQTLPVPSRSDANAIRLPSYDHSGHQSFESACVRLRSPLPSALITYTFQVPSR
jgi:hypothetical protein